VDRLNLVSTCAPGPMAALFTLASCTSNVNITFERDSTANISPGAKAYSQYGRLGRRLISSMKHMPRLFLQERKMYEPSAEFFAFGHEAISSYPQYIAGRSSMTQS
jgi:hypothetical protein